jgi:predicted nucleic acid-binding protein
VSAKTAYLDTSAFLKLVVADRGSVALQRALTHWPDRVSASLLRTEAVRALRRAGRTEQVGAARRLMRGLTLVRLDEPLLDRAAELEPLGLRSLDALHLAAALTVGPDLGVFLTYDLRLAEAATNAGLVVDSPA